MGGIIFGVFGACIRWIYGTIWRTIAKKKKFTFKEYVNGPENSDDWFDATGHEFANRIVGFIAIMTICFLLYKFCA